MCCQRGQKADGENKKSAQVEDGNLGNVEEVSNFGDATGDENNEAGNEAGNSIGGESGVGKSILEPKSWEAKRRSSPEGKRVHDIESWGLA